MKYSEIMKVARKIVAPAKSFPAGKRKKTSLELAREDVAAGRIVTFEMDSKEALDILGLDKIPERSEFFPNET